MINIREIRIGNLVYKSLKSGNGRTLIKDIDCKDIINLDNTTVGFYNYAPITITEDILLKLGFVESGHNCRYYTLNDVNIWDLNGIYCNDIDLPINSLHQLQNLYFALTGEELPTDKILKG